MSYQQAMEQFNDLCRKYHAQQVNYQQFCQAVDQLRVQDGSGNWWQLSYDGKWMQWNGTAWIQGFPPESSGGLAMNADTAHQTAKYAQTALNTAQTLASGHLPSITGKAATLFRPLAGKSQKWWNVLSILGGGIGGALWYGYSSLDRGTTADSTTSLIMLAVPIVLIVLRKPIDGVLAKLNPIRNKIPRLLLIGIGVAIPYLTASFLYGSANLRNYPYIRWTVFLGPILSYLIIRTPSLTDQKRSLGFPHR
jgi:hypothetical protein